MKMYLLSTASILLFSMLSVCKSNFIDAPDVDTTFCQGSLAFNTIEDEKIVILASNNSLKITFKSVKVEGCGCFKVFRGRDSKGASAYIYNTGEPLDSKSIGFNRVKSVQKINDCFSIKSGVSSVNISFTLYFVMTISYFISKKLM